ncbi:MAG: hypothetical protein ACOC2N_06215 [Spirochaetota bacterium]
MRPDSMLLSAYVDGEVPPRFVPQIEDAIRNDESVRAEYEALAGLGRRLQVDQSPDVERSARRSWDAIQARLHAGDDASVHDDVWHRRVGVPLPALAGAATLVLALGGILLWALLGGTLLLGPPAEDDYLAGGNDVDVTIRVDGAEMDQVLQWLVDKNMLGEVSIQLPEQRFQIVGEPVFVKPSAFQGEVVQ